jgi:hypothetical protein
MKKFGKIRKKYFILGVAVICPCRRKGNFFPKDI